MLTPEDAAALIAVRRAIHAAPEVGLQLPHTQAVVLEALAGLPLQVRTGRALSSVVAVLRGAAPGTGRAVLLRADLDALPIRETSGLPFAARGDAAHACGHDLHAAILVGAARVLSARRAELAGDVVFVFQPGEEAAAGARLMLDEGLLDEVVPDAAYAVHVAASGLPSGVFAGRGGALMSGSSGLRVRVHGVGGHGATPHRARDAVTAAADMIGALQTMITRRFDVFDPVIISVGRVRAGEVDNAIPSTAEFDATMRAFSPAGEARLRELVPQVLAGLAAAHGVTVDVDIADGYPVTRCDPGKVQLARDVVRREFGADRWYDLPSPLTASEDFAYVLDKVPGAMLLLGAATPGADPNTLPGNHAPDAVFDEDAIARGATALAAVALAELAPQ